MDIISQFLQEDTEELGLITKTGSNYVTNLERSNFHPALRGILNIIFKRQPNKQDIQIYQKIKENYTRIKSQFVDGTDRNLTKKANIVALQFDHKKPTTVTFKMEAGKNSWIGTIDVKQMKVQDVKQNKGV